MKWILKQKKPGDGMTFYRYVQRMARRRPARPHLNWSNRLTSCQKDEH